MQFGGHGVALNIHVGPFVFHIGIRGTDMILAPGMVFTIEPMINGGSHEIFINIYR
ncbi:hypothetical protein Ctaglu_27080 [Clostridium tagluense]|uniref:Peptidase M24 domain-containing protein n=1 Tax=Clostridium tagluense TaxID=360422 RepID=A0A401UNI2_9CLOT|nr:hypothetical protein Ctaglu_27080 [Clostridium tagluense]